MIRIPYRTSWCKQQAKAGAQILWEKWAYGMSTTSVVGILRLRLTQKARQPALRMTGFLREMHRQEN
jgi:hypothetical protein